MATPTQQAVLPPGPKTSRLWNTLQVLRNPRKAFETWTAKYGDPFFVHALNGPIVLTGRPDLIREIFANNPAHYDVFGVRAMQPMLGEGSMLLMDGERHRRERKLMMPMFHGDRMRAYGDIMRDATLQALEEQTVGEPFKMLGKTTQISLQVIVQAVLGGEDSDSIRELMARSRETIRKSNPILFFSPKMQFHFCGLSPWDRFTKARVALREAFDAEFRRRDEDPTPREDILTMLLDARYEDGSQMNREHLYDELGTFLFAGHETSAIAMAWATYHLLRNPDKLAELKSELATIDATSPAELSQLSYLKAIVSETLRLNPIVTEVLRVLNKPMDLGEYHIPPGVAVAPAAVMVHYNPEVYEAPEEFRPERFLDKQYGANEFLPFGGGARRCAGAAFALYEMAIVLGTLFSRYELELLERKEVVPSRRQRNDGTVDWNSSPPEVADGVETASALSRCAGLRQKPDCSCSVFWRTTGYKQRAKLTTTPIARPREATWSKSEIPCGPSRDQRSKYCGSEPDPSGFET